ncbi:MBL fold metallo-hydrolase [bacterium]|nr:MBL fold metallo-hydrolase [bacterium]
MKRKLRIFFILVLLSLAVFIWQRVFATSRDSLLEVNFLNVGQGDSILIEMPYQNQVLIDGGPGSDVVEKIAKEMPFFDRKIEMVILTHPDRDHISGLFSILDTYKVDKVLLPNIRYFDSEKRKVLYETFKRKVREQGGKIIFGKRGQRISFSENSRFLILWPIDNLKIKKNNDYSIVSLFSFGNMDFLFTGDISKRIEPQLFPGNLELKKIEVVKIAHHGSRYSTSEFFIKRVSPETAIISVGENNYGHPAREVLDNLRKYGIKTFRTDENGKIKIISDGNFYEVIPER